MPSFVCWKSLTTVMLIYEALGNMKKEYNKYVHCAYDGCSYLPIVMELVKSHLHDLALYKGILVSARN